MQKKYYEELRNWFNKDGSVAISKMMKKYGEDVSNSTDLFYIFSRALIDERTKSANKTLDGDKSIDILFNRIDSKYGEQVNYVRNNFTKDQIESIILNFHSKPFLGMRDRNQNFYIPEGVRNLVARLLEIRNEDKIFHPFCMNGEFITDFIIQYPHNIVDSIDINTANILISKIKASLVLEDVEKFKIVQGEYLSANFSKSDYNKIFSMPPFSVNLDYMKDALGDENLIKLYEDNNFGSYTDWLYLLKAILNQKLDKGIFITSSKILFDKKDEAIRKYLIENGLIEGIIQLPSKLFIQTAITTNIIILSKGNDTIKMVDASEMFTKEANINVIDNKNLKSIIESYYKNTEKSKSVNIKEIKENNYNLLAKRYTSRELNLDNYVHLKDIAEIKRGYANIKQKDLIERLSDKPTHYRLLTASDINDEFNIEELDSLIDIKENEKVYCIENGEIAFSRGGQYKSILINKENEQILVNGTIYIISCNEEKMNPYYLQMYLSSEHCLKQLSTLDAGTIISFIGVDQLGDLKIPKVSKELEKEISEKYKSILSRYEIIRLQKKRLEEEKREIISEVL